MAAETVKIPLEEAPGTKTVPDLGKIQTEPGIMKEMVGAAHSSSKAELREWNVWRTQSPPPTPQEDVEWLQAATRRVYSTVLRTIPVSEKGYEGQKGKRYLPLRPSLY